MDDRAKTPASALHTSGDLAADRRYAWAMAALKDGAVAEAVDLFGQAAELAPRWAPVWLGLGDARAAAGDGSGAVEALETCLALDPPDRLGAGPRLARLGRRVPAQAMSEAYVAGLFDEYAPRFERHLTQSLAYRGPALIMTALDAAAPAWAGLRVLDLGCGTGLMGEAIRPRAAWLAGCDLSAAMVEVAMGRGVYDRVETGELVEVLRREPEGSLDLVTAADVLVYVGDLEAVFAAVSVALRRGGVFAFTSQTFAEGQEPEGGSAIGEDLRFRHGERHVRSGASSHGLEVMRLVRDWERRERGEPLPGLVVVCRKA